MLEPSRYRSEHGEPCIDVKVRTVEHMFDNRDPAPFRERDLDPNLAEYLLDAGEDLYAHDRIRVVFWVEQACAVHEVEAPFRAHFQDVIARIRRARRQRRKTGQVALFLAVVLVVVLVALSQLVASRIGGSLGTGLKEGLVISSWVVMWRPVETLIYDWIPARHQRKVAAKLLAAPVEVRTGSPGTASA